MIFQNFGFNRQAIKVAAAPPAALFPDQATQVWTSTDTAQWLSGAATQYAIGNGVTYGSYSTLTSLNSNTFSGCIARNGKIYMGGDAGSPNVQVWDTNTNTLTSITMPSNLVAYGSAIYNDYTKRVYIPGNGIIFVVDTLTDTYVTSITNPLGNNYMELYSSGYDARYIYGNGWFQNGTWFKIDCSNNTGASTGQSTGGDTLQGPMAKNGKLYMGGGGGSSAGFHVWDANTDTNQFVSAMGNISDIYRGAANHYDGYVYTLPAYGASQIWQINPSTNGATAVLSSVPDYRITNHLLAADGQIYGFGTLGTSLVYNPVANTYTTISVPAENFQWSVLDASGNIYIGQNSLYKIPASGVSGTLDINGRIARMR